MPLMATDSRFTALELFAGGGMARLGLEPAFETVFANDFDADKCQSYRDNFGGDVLWQGDIAQLSVDDLPSADLAWASFPCQDLSLAGARGGLSAARSGTFWPFLHLMRGLKDQGRAPPLIALENVAGWLTSSGGADFIRVVSEFAALGYHVGALLIDAADFTPQSRPRVFLIASLGAPPPHLIRKAPDGYRLNGSLAGLYEQFPADLKARWVWWRLPQPGRSAFSLPDMLEDDVDDRVWRTDEQCEALVALMAPLHRQALAQAEAAGERRVGLVYRRMRGGAQRAEVRYDGIAGCLRTLKGGSSRQLLLVSENGRTRLRPLLPREGARLMGLPETYVLPKGATKAFGLLGDGVCVPAVRHLTQRLLAPLATSAVGARRAQVA